MEKAETAARVFMGDSLGFHIIFVMFGLTLPLLVLWFEYLSVRRRDPHLLATAKFWSKIMALLVVTGVLSGTIIALQMSLVWPGILEFGGKVIGLPFMLETYFFLIEAVFLSLYLATWDKVNRVVHMFFGLMTWLGATGSAFVITSVNGWMNYPTGFDYINGQVTNVDIFGAMMSVPALVTFAHSMPGYYFAATTFIVGLYVWRLVRQKPKDLSNTSARRDYSTINRLMIFAAICLVFSAITADITGKYLAQNEPAKLAALELTYKTETNVPLIVGGIDNGNEGVAGPHVKVPGGLSLLACGSTDCEVQGLDKTPKNEQPPLYIHTIMDIKMTLITILAIVFPLYFLVRWKRPNLLKNKLLLLAFIPVSWFGILIIELGWMMTEIGRQPWAVRGFVTTAEALTKTNDVTTFGYLFPLAYVALGVATVLAIRVLVKKEKLKKGGAL